jgi:carboxypeptidase C (cathepsin A)
MRNKIILFLSMILLLCGSETVFAQTVSSQIPVKTDSATPEISVTRHAVTIEGKLIHYTATAGTMLLKNEKGDSVALLGFTAYVKDGETDAGNRPVTFAYNGGPGSSSMWLHMGALGPRVVVTNDPGITTPAPYKTIDNEHSILDLTDLVMIDPVGTGLSHPIAKATVKDFWGVDQDIKSVSQLIKQYITMNDRWNSPKYLLGESYGTFRSAGVSDYLFENMGIEVNGVILVSSVLDYHTLTFKDDISYELYLPTYAAVA